MADNLTTTTTVATPPSGTVYATDDVVGVHYPIGKIAYGALDTATLVATGGSGLPVQVDAALPAGANNIGDVDVLTIAAGDNNIGNVDIVTMPALPSEHTRNEAFTQSIAAGAEFDDTLPVAATEGNVSPLRVSSNRNLYTTLRDAAGNERGANVTAANALVVDGSAVTQPVSGTVTANQGTPAATANRWPVQITDGTDLALVSAAGAVIVDGSAVTQPVSGTVSVTEPVSVDDNAASLTVDAPVGTPVNVQIGNATLSVGVIDETGASAVDALAVGGGTAHDAVDSGNPIKIGGVAVAGGATPTPVAAADRVRWIFNQHGIPYVLPGHPNLIVREFDFGTTAQTDLNLAAALVAADERIVVIGFEGMCDMSNTANVSIRAGFGTASVPTASATGVSGMIASHPGVPPGSGFILGGAGAVLAIGGLGEEPRLTTNSPTTGNVHVVIRYFLIDETP